MENGPRNEFRTLDAYLTGWLVLQGFKPTLISDGHKILFVFSSSEKLLNSISEYNGGATVEVARFVLTVKNLKAQVFSCKVFNGISANSKKLQKMNDGK